MMKDRIYYLPMVFKYLLWELKRYTAAAFG